MFWACWKGDIMGVSGETLLWVFISLAFFCVLLVSSLLWISQRTYKRMLSKIDIETTTTYYDVPKKEPPLG
jgi:hypothetical protein